MNKLYGQSAGARFKELATIVHGELFLSVIVYADETGIHDATGMEPGSEVIVVAGYAGREENWVQFSNEWESTLKRHGISYFHMQDFANVRNKSNDPSWLYYGWSDKRRHDLLFDLAPLAKRHTLFGVANIVSVRDYDRIFPTEAKALLGHPYYLCLIGFFAEIIAQVRIRAIDLNNEKFTFLFDSSDAMSPQTTAMFQRVQKDPTSEGRMGTLTFGDDKDFLPLQAADLLAYRVRQNLTRLVSHERAEAKEMDDALGLTRPDKHVQMCGADEKFLKHMVDRVQSENRPWDWDAKPPAKS